jgi:DNA-binding Lrp family transcriptional regulator
MEVVSEPWKTPAEKAGVTVERLIEVLGDLKEKGALRRVAAVLFHRRMGFRANGMGVWQVPEERVEEVGPIMGSFRSVSHCYLRPTYPDWPYNVFSMVHGKTKDECEEILDAIAEEIGIMDRTSLYSTKEYKKTRVPYFTQEMVDWENARL